ncbi:MAG TPA: hypothetical protein VIC27_10295, partial [Ktedonobacterales bacterium]
MWGRRRAEPATVQAAQATGSERLRALSAIDELRRRADWEGLTDAERGALRSDFAAFPASGGSSTVDIAVQQWVAALVAPTFQTESAQLISAWLSDAPPDAHLYIGGDGGQGRHSLIATLARQAMTQRPTPPDYCYIPQPSAMAQALLLPLPAGTGSPFTKAIDKALRLLTSAWNADNADSAEAGDSGNAAAASAPAAEAAPPARSQLVAQAFAPLQAPELAPARAYVDQLRAAFESFATSQADLPVTYDDMPTWLVSASSGTAGTSGGGADGAPARAPVVIGSLVRDKLDDLLIR